MAKGYHLTALYGVPIIIGSHISTHPDSYRNYLTHACESVETTLEELKYFHIKFSLTVVSGGEVKKQD
jgi:hypothetical protein